VAELFNPARFLKAQEEHFANAHAELKRGRKTSHWMWFIFPQMKGLGHSSMANFYGISSRAEAEAYLQHPVLGQRLVDCTALVNSIGGSSIEEIFGPTDAMKFRSCTTLFAAVDNHSQVFAAALRKYFQGIPDKMTLNLLNQAA
jgi:uncharacterized protein (DUF1810 family)